MKKYILMVLVLSFTFLGIAEDKQEPRTISVTGEADVKVAPNEMILDLNIGTNDMDLRIAKNQNDDKTRKVLEMADKYNIEKKYVQTSQLNIEPRYHNDTYDKESFRGYFVRKTIIITLKDISKFEEFLTDVLEAGVNYVNGITFRTTELRKYKDQARSLAVKAAREKAEAMAKELGQKIGRPYTIKEEQSSWWSYNPWYSRYSLSNSVQNVQSISGGEYSYDSAIAPGQITVNARVSVSFELK